MKARIPTFDELMNPMLAALRELGGSGSIDEIYEKVIAVESFPDEIVNLVHDPEKSNLTEIEYRLAWARTYLKQFGHLENSKRGVWVLTQLFLARSLPSCGRNTKRIEKRSYQPKRQSYCRKSTSYLVKIPGSKSYIESLRRTSRRNSSNGLLSAY
jgi:restriction endonuclease Mrr